jgi:aryl-alcohol dehydrogenase-like predicted oxidoreductase
VAREAGRTVAQVALNWLTTRPTVSTVVIGARDEKQLRENLGAVGWTLSAAQRERLAATSLTTAAYPYFPYRRQAGFARLSPPIT